MKTVEITETVARKVLEVVDAGLVNGVGNPIPGQMCVEAAVCYALGLPHGDDPKCVSPTLRSLKIRINDSDWSSNESRANGLRRLAVAQLGSLGHLDEKKFVNRLVDHAIRVSTPRALRIAAELQTDSNYRRDLLEAAYRCEGEGTEAAAYAAATAADAAAYRCEGEGTEATAAAAANAAYSAAAANAATAAATAADAAAYAAATAAYSAKAATAATNAAANAAAYAAATAAYSAKAANARDKSLAEYAEAVVQILIELGAPGCQWLPLTEIAS